MMEIYMTSQTDIIKDKLNILDVVMPYVKLEKAGKTYKGKSPFNNEKTPSFFVNPEKGFFYCFSSGKGGDIFTFIQEMEKVEFPEALKLLADKAGVELGESSLKDQSAEKRLFSLLDLATKWYEVNLRKNKDAVEYLLERGLTKDTIIKFRIGFAQDSWRDIYEYLHHKKYTDAEIEQAGLSIPKQGSGYYDRFRSRIMFPLFDGRGRVVGFSGRIFGDDENTAKYINSPEGPLFDKSAVLYGYHTAKTAMSKADACILVEGQFDVLMSQQAGYTHTVAISGTGLTDGHIKMISRFTDTVILSLDSDKAGIKATRRSVIAAYEKGLKVKVAVMDQGQDPADTIKHSAAAWGVALDDAQHYIDYRLLVFTRENHSLEEKMNLVQKDIFEFVSFIKSAVLQDSFLQKISLFLGVSVDAVRKDFANYTPHEIKLDAAPEKTLMNPREQLSLQQELHYLGSYVLDRDIVIPQETLDDYNDVFTDDLMSAIAVLDEVQKNMYIFVYTEQYENKPESFMLSMIHDMLKRAKVMQIDIELKKNNQDIQTEQLKHPNTVTESLKDLMKKSNMLLTQKQDLENTNHTKNAS